MGCGGSKTGDDAPAGGQAQASQGKASGSLFDRLEKAESNSLLKKHLTRAMYDELCKVKSDNGATIDDVIRSGVENPSSSCGVYAPDPQSYTVFAKLFDKIIADYHQADEGNLMNPASDFGDPAGLKNIDPEGKYVLSTRTRLARTIGKFPFNPIMSEQQYKDMETIVSDATKNFTGGLAGDYHSLKAMSEDQKTQLIDDHLLYKEGDKYLGQANALNHWPTGRGIYMNTDKTFLIWVGEEDHLRLISMQKGGDLGEVVSRLKQAVDEFSKHFDFASSGKLGFLTFCPTNLGTTIRSSVHIKLPLLSKDMDKFQKVADENKLQIRGIHGEHSESEGGVYDISNKRRFGATEHDVIMDMYTGCCKLIELEKELEEAQN